jgi:hypothetical protein
MDFKPIPVSKNKKSTVVSNKNIGSIDYETFTDSGDIIKIYALGFMSV